MDLFDKRDDLPFDMPGGDGYSATALESGGWRIRIPKGEILYVDHFFDKEVSNQSLEYLHGKKQNGINWKQEHIKLYGKTSALPRITAWYGDNGKTYTYSGITSIPNAWNTPLLDLKERIEVFCGGSFTGSILCRNASEFVVLVSISPFGTSRNRDVEINPIYGGCPG